MNAIVEHNVCPPSALKKACEAIKDGLATSRCCRHCLDLSSGKEILPVRPEIATCLNSEKALARRRTAGTADAEEHQIWFCPGSVAREAVQELLRRVQASSRGRPTPQLLGRPYAMTQLSNNHYPDQQ